jgi:hypothetical protein
MLPPALIQEHIAGMKLEAKELRKQIVQICWHMRGGVTRDEAWSLSYVERKDIMDFIKERIKFVEKTGMPLL